MENWLITDAELLPSKTYQIHDIVNTHKKIIDRLEKRREGVHKFTDKNIFDITELNSQVRENQRNISQTAK